MSTSDEIAEDYRSGLEDLQNNDRYQISNLTLVAKENVPHAEAIARTLTSHISRAPPARKLPALYVLDSICKNVGSPYTVYFGRNLYQTFMQAYSQVDLNVRRKLEEMLKTWREPVPGSTSTQPVFQLTATDAIVNNLNKLRATAAPQARYPTTQAPPARLQPIDPFRNTPTPPQHLPQRPPSQVQVHDPYSQHPQHATYQAPTPQQQYSTPQPQVPAVDLAKLNTDIDDLTTDAKIECATHPMDTAAEKKLTTLQTLKEILESGGASSSDLVDIRNSINHQMTNRRPAPTPTLPTRPPAVHPSQRYPQPALPAGLNTASLAELLRATASQTSTPQPPFTAQLSTPPISHATPVQPPAPFSLIDQLKAAGYLSAASTPPQGVTPPVYSAHTIEVTFTSASIKIPRPHLVSSFLNAKPNQCSSCGRRFTSDETGKEKKARHLDWHFKTKARMIEAEKRGQNRSWYVDEREWMSSREYDDDTEDGINSANTSPVKKQQQDFVRAPSDPVLRSMPCPIDQEPFKSEWSEEVQDFIWRDAVLVAGRYMHASCYREVTGRTATPDSVLGKRKAAEDANGTFKSKLKVES